MSVAVLCRDFLPLLVVLKWFVMSFCKLQYPLKTTSVTYTQEDSACRKSLALIVSQCSCIITVFGKIQTSYGHHAQTCMNSILLYCIGWLSIAFGNGCVISLYKPTTTLQLKLFGFILYIIQLSHHLLPKAMDKTLKIQQSIAINLLDLDISYHQNMLVFITLCSYVATLSFGRLLFQAFHCQVMLSWCSCTYSDLCMHVNCILHCVQLISENLN